jgi:PAT family beta-lactamase induction signal transducer AmpG
MASDMLNPFYLDIGFTKTQIGLISKPIGVWATIVGGIVGGIVMLKISLKNALLYFGILMSITTLLLAALARTGPNPYALGFVIFFETFASGMGSAAYAAFMMSLTNKKFTGTQYALLSSLMGIPRTLFGASTGYLAKHLGWEGFFIFCTIMTIPALIMLRRFSRWTMPQSTD